MKETEEVKEKKEHMKEKKKSKKLKEQWNKRKAEALQESLPWSGRSFRLIRSGNP